ncbi:MAG: type I-E CRISPR-associated protein Cse1/CasA, partial [Fimbriimonadaceae bacterium]|nr:type I-E CRISPR-associated protein Cse1/CasA [Fimbriimonadaceae bacterium]
MSRPTFNVLTEPWIPVVRLDGTREELGIMACLLQAHEIREIRDPSPIIEFGLYRLLVAFVLDALILADKRPEDAIDLKALIAAGRFPAKVLEEYANHCGAVFDLFDPERPFLQTAFATEDPGAFGPVEQLFHEVGAGSEAIHWHHCQEGRLELAGSEAARALVAVSPFMKQGGRGYSPSVNGSSPLYVLPVGQTLFDTLVMNIPTRQYGAAEAGPAWRRGSIEAVARVPEGMLDGLTWQPRKLSYKHPMGPSDAVNRIHFSPGVKKDGNGWIDPNLAYRWTELGVDKIAMQRRKPIWRDAGALFVAFPGELGKGDGRVAVRRPDVISDAYQLNDSSIVNANVYGMQAKQANVTEWVKSTIAVPARLGNKARICPIVEAELALADVGMRLLRSSVLQLSPEFLREEAKPPTKRKAMDKRSVKGVADRAERGYWTILQQEFGPLMARFAELPENAPDTPELITETRRPWREAIEQIARDEFERAAKDLDADSDALERQV